MRTDVYRRVDKRIYGREDRGLLRLDRRADRKTNRKLERRLDVKKDRMGDRSAG